MSRLEGGSACSRRVTPQVTSASCTVVSLRLGPAISGVIMKQALCALICAASVGISRQAAGQEGLRYVRRARLVFVHVDSIAFLFGVDTAAVRKRITERMVKTRISLVNDPHAPSLEVTIRVTNPPSAASASVEWGSVALRLESPPAAQGHYSSTLWSSESRQELTALRLLPALVGTAVDFVVDELSDATNYLRRRPASRRSRLSSNE